jgi:hypothetical protein
VGGGAVHDDAQHLPFGRGHEAGEPVDRVGAVERLQADLGTDDPDQPAATGLLGQGLGQRAERRRVGG